MLIFKRLIHSASRGLPQWVELHYDDMDKLHPPWPLPPAVSGQRPVSRVPAAAAGAEWAGPQEGGPRRMEERRGKAEAPGETHGGVIITCLQDCRNCFRVITSEREARSEFLLIYTKNLSMSGRPAGPPARRPAGRGHAFGRLISLEP